MKPPGATGAATVPEALVTVARRAVQRAKALTPQRVSASILEGLDLAAARAGTLDRTLIESELTAGGIEADADLVGKRG